MSAVEEVRQYSTQVDCLADAWTFLFEYIDRCGPDPSVEISPFWTADVDDEGEVTRTGRKFTVTISGTVEQDQPAQASEEAQS